MKKNYRDPMIEVEKVEVEEVILASGLNIHDEGLEMGEHVDEVL